MGVCIVSFFGTYRKNDLVSLSTQPKGCLLSPVASRILGSFNGITTKTRMNMQYTNKDITQFSRHASLAVFHLSRGPSLPIQLNNNKGKIAVFLGIDWICFHLMITPLKRTKWGLKRGGGTRAQPPERYCLVTIRHILKCQLLPHIGKIAIMIVWRTFVRSLL